MTSEWRKKAKLSPSVLAAAARYRITGSPFTYSDSLWNSSKKVSLGHAAAGAAVPEPLVHFGTKTVACRVVLLPLASVEE